VGFWLRRRFFWRWWKLWRRGSYRELVMKRSSNPRKFFTKDEKERILLEIKRAEMKTTGEIAVHLVRNVKGDIFERGKEAFFRLGLHKTIRRNAVLFFICTEQRKFAIIADEGIDKKVHEGFWKDIALKMEENFKEGRFAEGLIEAIKITGERLSEYFPFEESDINEIPDQITEEN
jgi:uncharacterized membrane protein